MTNWLKFIETECSEKGRWDKGEHFGDWLSLDAGNEATGGFTDKNLIATAMYAYSTSLLIKMGKVIGKDGRIGKAIRTIVKAAGNKSGEK